MTEPFATHAPRTLDQHADAWPGSPVAVCGVFVALLQARFAPMPEPVLYPDDRLPWVWLPTPTPDQDAGGSLPTDTPETAQPSRRIFIERANEYPDARDTLPALYIGRGAISASRDSVGHRVDFTPHTGGNHYASMLQMPLSVDCCARNMAESESLADIVFHFLLASNPALCAAFGFHSIEPPTLAPPEVLRRTSANIEAWKTTVYTQLMFQVQWRTWQNAPLLNEIRQTLTSGSTTVTTRTVLQRRNGG